MTVPTTVPTVIHFKLYNEQTRHNAQISINEKTNKATYISYDARWTEISLVDAFKYLHLALEDGYEVLAL